MRGCEDGEEEEEEVDARCLVAFEVRIETVLRAQLKAIRNKMVDFTVSTGLKTVSEPVRIAFNTAFKRRKMGLGGKTKTNKNNIPWVDDP